MKSIEDNPNNASNKKRVRGVVNPDSQNSILAMVNKDGQPLVYEEYSDDEESETNNNDY